MTVITYPQNSYNEGELTVPKYHLNWDGKIYRCRAKIRPCPYGADFHADTKEELYHKIAKETSHEVGVMNPIIERMNKGEFIDGIEDISQYISSTEPAPLEISVANLDYVIQRTTDEYNQAVANRTERDEPKRSTVSVGHWTTEAEQCIENLAMAAAVFIPSQEFFTFEEYYNRTIKNDRGPWPTRDVVDEAISRAQHNSKYNGITGSTDHYLIQAKAVVREAGSDFSNAYTPGKSFQGKSAYHRYHSLGPVERDFNRLSAALNASKIISSAPVPCTRPISEVIAGISNDELVTLYEDFSTYDQEVELLVAECNYFNYVPDENCSRNYNNVVSRWYERNQQAWKHYVLDSPRRITMSMAIADELTKRGVNFGDVHQKQTAADGLIADIDKAIEGINDKPRW